MILVIKLGGETLIEEGARMLNELSGLIDTSRQKEVAFKMVITATGGVRLSTAGRHCRLPAFCAQAVRCA